MSEPMSKGPNSLLATLLGALIAVGGISAGLHCTATLDVNTVVAYVDSGFIAANSKVADDLRKELDADKRAKEQQLQQMGAEIQKLTAEQTADKKEEKPKKADAPDLDKKRQELEATSKKLNDEFVAFQKSKDTMFKDRVAVAIDTLAKKRGLKMVVEKNLVQYGGFDATKDVLTILDAK